MVSAEDVLARAGLQLDARGELRAATMRIARRLAAAKAQRVGFVPADDAVGQPAALIHLGLAVGELTGKPVAIVDANARFPGLSAIANVAEDGDVLATRWLRDTLAVITAAAVQKPSAVLSRLDEVLEETVDAYAMVLVDLTGFHLIGDHVAAARRMDKVVVTARRNVAREKDVRALAHAFPPEQFFGVLLVG